MKKIILAFIALLTLAGSANAQLGSLSSDLVYTPVTPCRIMDTRNPGISSGILQAGTVRSFYGRAGTTFADQGGAASGCNTLNSLATAAILVNFTVVTPDTAGYITAFPANVADASKPLAATVNFTAGSVVGNNATIKLSQTGTGYDFKIYSTSNVHVVADIVGYYAMPVATALSCINVNGAVVSVAGGAYVDLGTVSCAVGYTAMGMTISATSNVVVADSYINNSSGQIYVRSFAANPQNVLPQLRCCQIPGR